MNNHIADPSFDIKADPALAILALLSQREPDFAVYNESYHEYEVDFATKPWYNGRERGIMISMCPNGFLRGSHYLHIAVFQHRNSDTIDILSWETTHPYWNHALEDKDIFEVAYANGIKGFSYNQIYEATEWIYDKFAEYYKANYKVAEVKNATDTNKN